MLREQPVEQPQSKLQGHFPTVINKWRFCSTTVMLLQKFLQEVPQGCAGQMFLHLLFFLAESYVIYLSLFLLSTTVDGQISRGFRKSAWCLLNLSSTHCVSWTPTRTCRSYQENAEGMQKRAHILQGTIPFQTSAWTTNPVWVKLWIPTCCPLLNCGNTRVCSLKRARREKTKEKITKTRVKRVESVRRVKESV